MNIKELWNFKNWDIKKILIFVAAAVVCIGMIVAAIVLVTNRDDGSGAGTEPSTTADVADTTGNSTETTGSSTETTGSSTETTGSSAETTDSSKETEPDTPAITLPVGADEDELPGVPIIGGNTGTGESDNSSSETEEPDNSGGQSGGNNGSGNGGKGDEYEMPVVPF